MNLHAGSGVGTYKDKMLEAHMNALKLTKSGQAASMPHVEQGMTNSVQMPRQDSERDKKLKTIREAHQKGAMNSEEMLANLVKSVLPVDDPMWRIK